MRNTLRFLLFFGISVFLFWLAYRDQNWENLWKVLKEDVDYTWIVVGCIMGIASHVSRAMRWQLLTASMGYRIGFWNSFMGVMIGYFANLALPRMGEFTRCGVVGRYEKVPFANLLGTVVTERVIDLLILLSLTLVVAVTQFRQLGVFLDNNPEVKTRLEGLSHSAVAGVVLAGGVVLLLLLWKYVLSRRLGGRIRSFFRGLKVGLLTVRDVRRKGWFIFHSLFIWLMYFLMFYVCFFCFEFTSHLGMLVALTVFVLSSYGMVAPVQGGIGAWHFMVIAALLVYLPHTPGVEGMTRAFALLTHGSMTLLYIAVGMICLIALPFYNRRRLKNKEGI